MTILGYRPEEMTGRVGSEFIYPQDLDHARENMRQARRGLQTRTFEARYVHKTGRAVTLAWSCVWSEPEQLHFFIGRDVTSLKRAERLKNEFVATLSHELRTPLTSIAGALSLLVANTDAALSASTLRLLTIAHANSQRLLHLVRGILDMDKIELENSSSRSDGSTFVRWSNRRSTPSATPKETPMFASSCKRRRPSNCAPTPPG